MTASGTGGDRRSGRDAAVTIAVAEYPNISAVKDGTIRPNGVELDFVPIDGGMPAYFRRMVREGAYDICEMGVTTYLAAREYGAPLTALPIVASFTFPFSQVMVNTTAGVENPADLEGTTLAARTHTVTTVVWARGLIGDVCGVDFDTVSWVINDYEHTKEFAWPDGVELREGVDLSGLIDSGELAGGVGVYRGTNPDVRCLFPDLAAIESETVAVTGVNPISHVLVVRDEVLARDRGAIDEIYGAFVDAKSVFLDRLQRGEDLGADAAVLAGRRAYVGDDPVPYGIDANRQTLTTLLRYCKEQAVYTGGLGIEELFYQP